MTSKTDVFNCYIGYSSFTQSRITISLSCTTTTNFIIRCKTYFICKVGTMMWCKTKFEDKTSLKCMQFLTEGTIQEYLYILRDLPIMDKKRIKNKGGSVGKFWRRVLTVNDYHSTSSLIILQRDLAHFGKFFPPGKLPTLTAETTVNYQSWL